MTDQNTRAAGQALILPLTLLFSAVAVNYALSLFPYLIDGMPYLTVSRVSIAAAYTVVSVFFWIVYGTRNRRMFHQLAVAGCLILVGIDLYMYVFSAAAPELSMPYRLIWILMDMPLVAVYFLLGPYRPYFTGYGEQSTDIFPFLGALHIMWGVLGFAFALLVIGHPDPEFLLRPSLQVIVGLGILGRDRFFGLFGSFCLTILPFVIQGSPPRMSAAAGVVNLLRQVIVPSAVLTVLLLQRNSGFVRNTARYIFSDSASNTVNSCSSCGRQVTPGSPAGQRCPHCGAYVSTVQTGRR
ncbi:hypothetical protein JXO52_12535 [bacterium]|nr:hypothetical protein [bacterium]